MGERRCEGAFCSANASGLFGARCEEGPGRPAYASASDAKVRDLPFLFLSEKRCNLIAVRTFTTLVVPRSRGTLSLELPGARASNSPHGSQMRIFFHLVSASETIQDQEGVEVSRVEEAEAEAMKLVREAQGNGSGLRQSAGWRLEARDESGTLLFSFDLGGSG